MRNFQEIPTLNESDYGLFLIRKTLNITSQLLDQIHLQMLKGNFIISFERLFKGGESTLTLFAPRKIIQGYINHLDLLELEDYTAVDADKILVFEMGTKKKAAEQGLTAFFKEFPALEVSESIWWQVVLKAEKGAVFEVLPRVIIQASDQTRRQEIGKSLHLLAGGFLAKVPKPFTNNQLLQFYKQRSFTKGEHNLRLRVNQVLDLILLKG